MVSKQHRQAFATAVDTVAAMDPIVSHLPASSSEYPSTTLDTHGYASPLLPPLLGLD